MDGDQCSPAHEDCHAGFADHGLFTRSAPRPRSSRRLDGLLSLLCHAGFADHGFPHQRCHADM